MSKCSHGVHISEGDTIARYCQLCSVGSGGGLFTQPPIVTQENDLELRHWFCLKCLGTSKAIYDGGIWCVDCGYEDKEK